MLFVVMLKIATRFGSKSGSAKEKMRKTMGEKGTKNDNATYSYKCLTVLKTTAVG